MTDRRNISSGAPWEPIVGYSRAVRVGDTIYVSGTAAVDEGGQLVGKGDVYAQTKFILEKIERALKQAGAELKHVVQTRTYVTDISRWEDVARAHREAFADVRPAATMVQVQALISPGLLVEMEVTAVV